MGSVSKKKAGRRPVRSDRVRYVARARYLIGHPPFGAAIEAARAEWDAAHPGFAIGAPSPPSSPPAFPIPDGPAVPPKLDAALRAHNDWLRKVVATGARPYAEAEDGAGAGASEAEFAWPAFLGRLAADWWPPRWYPIADHPVNHPARRFLSGCLLWGPKHADEKWIDTMRLLPTWLPAPVRDVPSPADVTYWRVQAESLHRGMAEAARTGQLLTEASVAGLTRIAHDEGWAAMRAEADALRDQTLTGAVLCVPIHPGMTHRDWSDAKAHALDAVRERDRHPLLRAEVRRLVAEGKSVQAVAGLLGVARSTVDAWKNGPD